MNVVSQPYPQDYISETLRKSAWGETPLGLYPHEGIHSDWEAIISNVSSQFDSHQREELVGILKSQLGEGGSASQRENLDRLKQENTFLVVTGQQIHLGLGPMYVIYKIASAIVLCNDLNHRFSDKHFVPLFWMATEDHDVAEINHVDLFGDRFTCEFDWKRGVGDIPTQDLGGLWDWMKQKFQRDPAALQRIENVELMYQTEGQTLANATSSWVSSLFADFGLLVLDPNVGALKCRATKIFEADLFDTAVFETFAEQSAELKSQKITAPAHYRECNLFWIDAHRRERIVKDVDGFVLVDSGVKLDDAAMREILVSQPERLSPNVLLRPLYQQAILPSVAYIAGPTEYFYWLQTTKAFAHLGLPAPALIHRMGGVVVSAAQNKKISQIGLTPSDLFSDISDLKSMLMEKLTGNSALDVVNDKIEAGMQEYLQILYQWKSELLGDTKKQVEAFLKVQRKTTDEAISKFLASKLSDETWNSIIGMQNDVFSLTNPQERRIHFLQYFLSNQAGWLNDVCKIQTYEPESAFWIINL